MEGGVTEISKAATEGSVEFSECHCLRGLSCIMTGRKCVHLFFQCFHLKDSPLGKLGAITSTQCCLPIVKDRKYMVRNVNRFCRPNLVHLAVHLRLAVSFM